MKRLLHLGLLAGALFPGLVQPQGGARFTPTLDVNDMRLVVTYLSARELASLQGRYGVRVDLRDLRQDHRHGFSILKTHRATGARTCEIYLSDDKRPRELDDEGP